MKPGNKLITAVSVLYTYCPGKEAAMGIIVVSLTCTPYLWAALIALC